MASNDLQKFSDYLQKQGYGNSGKSQDSFSSSSSLELPKNYRNTAYGQEQMKGYLNPYSDGINTSKRTGPTIENLPLEQVVGDNRTEFEKLLDNQERPGGGSVTIGGQTFNLGNFASKQLSKAIDKKVKGGDTPGGTTTANVENTWTTEVTDYRNVYTPGRNNILQVDGAIGTQYGLDDFQWYPEEMTRFYEDDFFSTADEQFDFEAEANTEGFIGSKIQEVRDEVNDYVKQIGEVKDRIVDIAHDVKKYAGDVKEFLFRKKDKGSDEKGSDYSPVGSSNPLFQNIPVIHITEIQPKSDLAFQFEIFRQIGELASTFAEGSFGDTGDKISAFGQGLKQAFAEIAGDAQTNDYFNVFTLPNLFYTNLIGGKVRAKYTVPLSPQETYWHAKGSDGWESRTFVQQTFGSFGANLIKLLPGVQQVDIQGRPKFTAPTDGHAEFETTFTLFNYDLNALKKNLRFINSIVAGAWWTQVGFVQQASNLYDIKVPGRFRYYFCSADIKVDQVGKVRKLKDTQVNNVLTVLQKPFAEDSDGNMMAINPDVIRFIPDTYRITMTFKSLMPNNLNSYLNFVYNRNPQKGLQEDLSDIVTDAQAKAINDAIKDGDKNKIAGAIKNAFVPDGKENAVNGLLGKVGEKISPDLKKYANVILPTSIPKDFSDFV